MLRFADAPKKAINLSLNPAVMAAAKDLGLNISQTVDSLLAVEVNRRYWEKWNQANKSAIDAYNERIHQQGLPLAKYSSRGKLLGDGKQHV